MPSADHLQAFVTHCTSALLPFALYSIHSHSLSRVQVLPCVMILETQDHGISPLVSSSVELDLSVDPRDELDIVQAEVARVERMLKVLKDKTHALRGRINDMHSPIIRMLPVEITAEIFQACIAGFDIDGEIDTKEFVPLVLGSVCSSWRRIAWSAPTLWSSLTLRLSASRIHTQMTILDEWLSRSGSLPLSMRLFSEEEIHWASSTTPGTAIEVIKKYCSRWRELDLRLPTSCYTFLPSSGDNLPMLVSLNLNPPGGQGERRHRVDMSSSAKIQHLSLSCVYLISMKFQWVHVTDLRLESFYVDECLEALRQSPQLESCSLRNIIGGDDGHAIPEAPLILPVLRNLTIENDKDTVIALLFDTIMVPNMTYFSYSGRSLIHWTALCALLARSPSLETFSLDQTVVANDDSFMMLLASLATLKTLKFSTRSHSTDHSPLDDDILRMCNPALVPEGKKCLLPQLEVLEYFGPQTFTWPVLLETLESRQRKPTIDVGDMALDEAPQIDTEMGQADGTETLPESAQEQKLKISEWQLIRLNITHRVANHPEPEPLFPRFQGLAINLGISLVTSSFGSENSERLTLL